MKNLMSADQRKLVTEYQDRGCGPQAIAMVMLLDVPDRGVSTHVCMFSHHEPKHGELWWGNRARAAIAYCLLNDIPLDTPEVTP